MSKELEEGSTLMLDFAKIAKITKTSTKVPMISHTRFQKELRMPGAVEWQASFRPGSVVSAQCGR